MAEASNVRPLRTVTKAVASGSRRDLLVALHDRLWVALQDERTQPRDLSPLSLRLKELHAEIESLDAERAPRGPSQQTDRTFSYDDI